MSKDSESPTLHSILCRPLNWLRMMAKEMHWSFVYGIFAVNGVSQGLGGAVSKVASDYYWKDVQRVMPSEAQVYQGITTLPWIIKPIWGLLTDVIPVAGYRRRPYFIFAGLLGGISMLILRVQSDICALLALLLLTAGSAGIAIGDVTIDACVAQNSITHPLLAADMQSMCGLSSSIGGLIGYSISGLLMHHFGSKEVLGLLSIPAALVFSVGMVMKEPRMPNFAYGQVHRKVSQANRTMWKTMKCPAVWRPCIFMYTALALSFNIQEGMFYWYTDTNTGPAFSQGTISFIFSIGSVGSLVGVLLYQTCLKAYPFRSLLFWGQLLSSISGMLDLILVLRLNSKLGIPDHIFAVMDESVSQMLGRIRWMPMLVLSSKLCPLGIEGTFFALLMSIDHTGMLTSSWGGGVLLDLLNVTRTRFDNLWLVILIRNLLRAVPLALIFLVPESDQNSMLLPVDVQMRTEIAGTLIVEDEDTKTAALLDNA